MITHYKHTVSLVSVDERKPKIGCGGTEPNSDSQGGGEGSYWPQQHQTKQWLTGWRRRVLLITVAQNWTVTHRWSQGVLLTTVAQNRTVTQRVEAKDLTDHSGTEPSSDSQGGGERSYWPQWHRTEQWLTGSRQSVLLTTAAQNRTVTDRVKAKGLTDHNSTELNSDSPGQGEVSYWPQQHRTEQWLTGWRWSVLLSTEPNSDSRGGGKGSYWPQQHRTEQWLTGWRWNVLLSTEPKQWLTGWRRSVLLTTVAQNRTVTHWVEVKCLTEHRTKQWLTGWRWSVLLSTEPNSDSRGGGKGSYWPQQHRTEQWLTGWRWNVLLSTEPNSDSPGWGEVSYWPKRHIFWGQISSFTKTIIRQWFISKYFANNS